MTPERMRIRLAEWAGWKRTFVGWQPKGDTVPRGWLSPYGREKSQCPNYPASLNVVRELERRLGEDQMFKYYQEIYWLVEGIRSAGPEYPAQHYLLHASAPQRCEALLRAIGKWEDE